MRYLFVEGCASAAPNETRKGSRQDPTPSFASTQLWSQLPGLKSKLSGFEAFGIPKPGLDSHLGYDMSSSLWREMGFLWLCVARQVLPAMKDVLGPAGAIHLHPCGEMLGPAWPSAP